MRKNILQAMLVMATMGTLVLAQAPPPAQKAKGPTKKEAEAFNAIQKASTPDEKIAAADSFVTKFADSQFKSLALYDAAEAADSKGDYIKAIEYGKLSMEADPNYFDPMLLVAGEMAQHTRPNDLDKTEKLTEATKYANHALQLIPAAVKPPTLAKLPDEQWEGYKKDATARGHMDLGLIAAADKKWDVAATEYKTAVDTDAEPDAIMMIRLANAYDNIGKGTDAVPVLDKVLDMKDLNPQIKKVAEAEKTRAEGEKK